MLKINKVKFEAVLAQHDFSLKTKAFASYLGNKDSYFYKFKKVLLDANFTNEQAEVYSIMLLNYHLNGSLVNWGNIKAVLGYGSSSRAARILFTTSNDGVIDLMSNWILTIKPLTYNKWLAALTDIKTTVSEIEAKKLNEPKDLTLKQIEEFLGFKFKIIF